jgi:hypothetical protein
MPAVRRTSAAQHASRARAGEATGSQRGELNEQAWQGLVEIHLPPLWSALTANGTPTRMAAEACEVAWLRLASSLSGTPDEAHTAEWLLVTARGELTRAMAREAVEAGDESDNSLPGPAGPDQL